MPFRSRDLAAAAAVLVSLSGGWQDLASSSRLSWGEDSSPLDRTPNPCCPSDVRVSARPGTQALKISNRPDRVRISSMGLQS